MMKKTITKTETTTIEIDEKTVRKLVAEYIASQYGDEVKPGALSAAYRAGSRTYRTTDYDLVFNGFVYTDSKIL